MLNFAEQTGSGAVMLVWSFSLFLTNFADIMKTKLRKWRQKMAFCVFFKQQQQPRNTHHNNFVLETTALFLDVNSPTYFFGLTSAST